MINEDNLIKWEIIGPCGEIIDKGKIIYNNEYCYKEFEYLIKNYPLSNNITAGLRCNRIAFYCEDKSIGLLTIRDLKDKLGDKFPNSFYFNNDMLYWENINQNKLLIKLGNFYKRFKL